MLSGDIEAAMCALQWCCGTNPQTSPRSICGRGSGLHAAVVLRDEPAETRGRGSPGAPSQSRSGAAAEPAETPLSTSTCLGGAVGRTHRDAPQPDRGHRHPGGAAVVLRNRPAESFEHPVGERDASLAAVVLRDEPAETRGLRGSSPSGPRSRSDAAGRTLRDASTAGPCWKSTQNRNGAAGRTRRDAYPGQHQRPDPRRSVVVLRVQPAETRVRPCWTRRSVGHRSGAVG
ncbi:hypothetical protein ACVWZD_001085 [Streptomyces sp. TE3672]